MKEDDIHSGIMADKYEYLLLLKLGVPIGMVIGKDEKNNIIDDYSDDPIGDVKLHYNPINNEADYFKKLEEYNFVDLMINPKYMNNYQAQNVLYCISFINDKDIFDIDTMNRVQTDIIDNAPLDYNGFMKLFNAYYTDDIKFRFINDFHVDEDRFFELSGLEKTDIKI